MIVARPLSFIFYLALFSQLVCAEGEVKGLKKIEYWKTGKVKQCDGYLKAKVYCRGDGTIEKIERFNMIGKRVEEALYDGRGKLKTGIDGWAAIRWIYSGPMLLYEIVYDETGKPMEMKMYSGSAYIQNQLFDEANAYFTKRIF